MIVTCLELSTSHLDKDTMRRLETSTSQERLASGWPAMSVANYEYGVFLTVPDLANAWVVTQLGVLGEQYPNLADALTLAQSLGVTLIRFDADAPTNDNLSTFDW